MLSLEIPTRLSRKALSTSDSGTLFKSVKLQIANDRKFLDLENHVDAAARSFLSKDSRGGLIKETQSSELPVNHVGLAVRCKDRRGGFGRNKGRRLFSGVDCR